MKPILLSLLLFPSLFLYSQNAADIRRIDSLKKIIDTATLQLQLDSTIRKNTWPNGMTTDSKEYHSWYFNSQQALKKVIWRINLTTFDSKDTISDISAISLYYNDEHLIKMEQVKMSMNKTEKMECYIDNDKLIYSTQPLKGDKDPDPERKIIGLSKMFLTQFNAIKKSFAPPTPRPSRSS